MKAQRLPSESSIQHATPVRLTTVQNLNFKSTDHEFANSGLKADFVARFEGYQPSFCAVFFPTHALCHSGLSTSLHPGSGPLNLKATTVLGCSSMTPRYILPLKSLLMLCSSASQVVNDDGLHGMVKASGSKILRSGQHVSFSVTLLTPIS
jgi:hypothetical protein